MQIGLGCTDFVTRPMKGLNRAGGRGFAKGALPASLEPLFQAQHVRAKGPIAAS